MINTSIDFRKALQGTREFRIKDKIILKNKKEIPLSMQDLMEYKINEATSASGKFEIGAAVIKEYTITLDNSEEQYDGYDFEGADIQAVVGLKLEDGTWEDLKKGTYRVYKASFNDDVSLQIKAYDEMLFLDRPYSESTLAYPATIREIVLHACSDCGVTCDVSTIEMGTYRVTSKPTGSVTYRDVISYCAQIMGCYARINHLGQLSFGWYDFDAIPSGGLDGGIFDTVSEDVYVSGDNVDGGTFDDYSSGASYNAGTFSDMDNYHHFYNMYSKSINASDITVTGVQISISQSNSKESYLYGKDTYALEIKDNPLIQSGTLQTVAKHIGDKIINKPFRPLSISMQCDPSVEAGDSAMVTPKVITSYATVITDTTFDLSGTQTVASTAETPTEKTFTRYSAATKILDAAKDAMNISMADYELMLRQMNQLAANTFGFYETIIKQDDGSVICYRHDKPKLEQSKVVWKSGIDGFFVTQNYTGKDSTTTWRAGFDSSGNAVLNMLAVIGIHWDWATGGTLTLGGQGNGNGIMKVLDSSGRLVVSIDSSGYNLYNQSGQIIASNDKRGYIVYSQPLDMSNGSHTYKGLLYSGDGIRRVSGSYDMADAVVEYIDITAMDSTPVSYDGNDNVTLQGTNAIATNTYTDNINPNGADLNIGGSTRTAGGAGVTGDATVGGKAEITGNAAVGGNATVTGGVSAGGDIKSNKYLRSSGLEVSAAAYMKYCRLLSDLGSGSGGHNVGIKAHTTGSGNFVTTDYWYFYKVSSSSKRYKDLGDNISDENIENWYNIQPLWAKYKDGYLIEGDENEGRYLPMFLAEDVEKYLPEAVTHEDGQVEDWNYRVIIPAMFAMLKQQHKEMQELKRMIGGNYGNKDQNGPVQ